MIVETVGRLLYRFIPSLSLSLILAFPLLFLVAIGLYLWPMINTFRKRIRQVDDLPGPRSTNVLLGNVPADFVKQAMFNSADHKNLIISMMDSISGYTQVYRKEKLFRVWLSWEPLIFLWHPETVEKVLANNFLLQKSSQYQFLHPWLGTGLLTSEGTKWRTRRKLLVPAFHFKILHDFVPVFNEQARVLIDRLREVARRKCSNCTVVDIVPVITACTLDIICETIMGASIGAQQSTNNKYCKSVTEVGECFLERLMQPHFWADQIYYRSEPGTRFSTNLVRLHEFTRKVIRNRKAELLNQTNTIRYKRTANGYTELEENEKDRRKAFLDLLLDHHIKSGELTEEDIREEVDTFMFEGHDTTAMALSWILYLLGHHPEIQARAAAEVDSLFEEDSANLDDANNGADDGDDKVTLTLDKIKSLKYLECCVKEGLRLCPSVPFIGRRLHEDMAINGYNVPKGTILFVYIFMLHRDPDIFPKPECFDPDRFLPENSIGRHPFAFVPFSAGPRNCIGQRFAMSELKVVLAYLLRYFRFESLDHRDKISAMMEMVYRPKSPLRLRIHERRKAEMFEPDSMDALMKTRNSLDGSIGNSSSLIDLGLGSVSASSSDNHSLSNHSMMD
ncbi:hypothetical protein RDWZM_007653 [Blomia tropicalis]|uniref:Uncharacterized protein n=1 Tax=Blomia tropicalis TaxID=40697 RepID=A0A9Q0M054_BLOTA|nr:hypothetical protein RDWZM_007653 [Blomia tropicalis]